LLSSDKMNLKALWDLTYGVYVIGSIKGGKLNAQIANTVLQLTAEPPVVAVSINKKNLTWEYIHEGKVFTASTLCQETPLPFIGGFGFKSGRDADKLAGTEYKIGVTGAPVVLENSASYLEVRVDKEVDVGTHVLFIGEVVAADVVSHKTVMTYAYYQQVKRGVTPAAAPTYAPGKSAAAQTLVEVKKPVEEKKEVTTMAKYKCSVCGYIYDPALGDPDGGIKPGTPFEALPDNWSCPVCGASKGDFEKLEA
jgi:rubredoxin/flavin reductase (DIM6/NTAB) family NADH-FMN oxidoreductase RutF